MLEWVVLTKIMGTGGSTVSNLTVGLRNLILIMETDITLIIFLQVIKFLLSHDTL